MTPLTMPAHRPVRIAGTTLRDAHQSLWATRMRTVDIMGIINVVGRTAGRTETT